MKHLRHLVSITTLSILIFSGCSTQPEAPKKPIVDATLPALSINGHISDMNAIAFEWKPVENEKVIGFYVYRNSPENKDNKLHRIATINNRYTTHYVDTTVIPNNNYLYRFSSFSKDLRESRASKTISANSTALLKSVSYFQSIGNMPRAAKLLWRPHTNIKVNRYILEKSTLEEPKWKELATINGRLNVEYIDLNLDDNRVYKYRLRSATFDNLISTPSDIVKIVTKPLPKLVQNIKASTNLPKQIELKWAVAPEVDFSHYNIYRSESEHGDFEYYVKIKKNRFVDKIPKESVSYFYKITSVDKDGLESRKGDIAIQGTTLSKPSIPVFVESSLTNNSKVSLSWKATDSRAQSYVIVKTTQMSFFKKKIEEIVKIESTHYVDEDITPDTAYTYQIISVDENNIRSLASKAVELESHK